MSYTTEEIATDAILDFALGEGLTIEDGLAAMHDVMSFDVTDADGNCIPPTHEDYWEYVIDQACDYLVAMPWTED